MDKWITLKNVILSKTLRSGPAVAKGHRLLHREPMPLAINNERTSEKNFRDMSKSFYRRQKIFSSNVSRGTTCVRSPESF